MTDPIKFPIVAVRPRLDGWTPEKQRDFIEQLADTGSVKEAAHRVGMTENSAYRLRRRADASGFDAAWEAALEKGLERLTAMAFERAITGTVQRRWYHGKLVDEERVHSERLLIYMLESGRKSLGRSKERSQVNKNWECAMDSLELGTPIGPPGGFRVWKDVEGRWVTNFPPDISHEGKIYVREEVGHPDYWRTLTPVETTANNLRQLASERAALAARERYFA